MRLKDAARRFNDALALDGYTGEELFKCAFTSFDDHAASGATTRRRVLSLPESIEIPARRCVSLYDEVWLVGIGVPDSYAGRIIRMDYGMKRATDLASICSPAQAILGTGTHQAYVHRQYVKDLFNTRSESDTSINWNLFIAPDESVQTGDILILQDQTVRLRYSYLPFEGLRILECDDLPEDHAQTAEFIENGVYDSASDSYTNPSSVSTPVFVFDYNQLYRLHTQADDHYEAGDVSVLVPKTASVTPVVSAYFNMLDRTWRALTVQTERDCWLIHARAS